jgi:outer membrane biosynthesis protein TonB
MDCVFKNMKYPREAVKNGIERIVVIRFAEAKDGEIINSRVIREIGGECNYTNTIH